MPFVITLGFATEHDRNEFAERVAPKVRGHETEEGLTAPAEGDGLQRLGIAVTSQSAARDLCHQIVAFLAHSKTGRVTVSWPGVGGEPQSAQVSAGAARDAETLAVRLGAAAKARMKDEG